MSFKKRIENYRLVPAPYLLLCKVVVEAQVFVLEAEELSVVHAQGAAQNEFEIELVYRKFKLALLVIFAGEGGAPVDDFQPIVALFAYIVAVVTVLIVV